MKVNNLLKLLFVTLFVFLGVAKSMAQSGNIQGTISDENGIYVSGANIFIAALNKGTVSDFDGRFTLVDVPEGNYNVQITYIGYADIDQEVTVTDGETASIIVELTPTNYQLDEVEVSGCQYRRCR